MCSNDGIKLFVDMDGTLTEWRKACSREHLFLNNYFYSLKPHFKLIRYLENINKENIEIFIASHYITDESVKEKNRWLDRYFNIKKENRIFIPSEIRKSIYIEQILETEITKDCILLDDFTLNLIEWEESSGTAIKALNRINRKSTKWHGRTFDIFKLELTGGN